MYNKIFGLISITGIITFLSYFNIYQKNKIKELEKILQRDVKFNNTVTEIKNVDVDEKKDKITGEKNPNLIYDDDIINNLINDIKENKNKLSIDNLNELYQILDSIDVLCNKTNETCKKELLHLEIEYDNDNDNVNKEENNSDSSSSKDDSYDKLSLNMEDDNSDN